jgi:hypothetical protein
MRTLYHGVCARATVVTITDDSVRNRDVNFVVSTSFNEVFKHYSKSKTQQIVFWPAERLFLIKLN